MKGLTTLAALPQAGGCMSALPAEVGEKPEPVVVMKADYFIEDLEYPEIDYGALE